MASLVRTFRFGVFEADVAQKTLRRGGLRVKIQEQPFQVLLMLLEHSGKIVSREELRQNLWQEGTFVDFDGSLNVALKKLRAAIDDDPTNPRFIETVPRFGYRFIAPVVVTEEPPPSPSLPQSPQITLQPVFPSKRAFRARRRLLIGVLATLIVVLAAFQGSKRWINRPSKRDSSNVAAAPIHLRKSLAVLGFQNLSGAESDTWISTALSDMLTTELGNGDTLRLVPGEDIANLRAYSPWVAADTLDRKTTSRIGTALGSDLLVLGSYAAIGKAEHEQLRVDVYLQDARSGEVIAEVSEIGAEKDLFGIVSRIGGKLRARLGITLSGDTDELTVQASLPDSPEAARLYSLGLEKLRSYEFEVARELFQQAAAAEPQFPLAHSMLSRADLFLGRWDEAKTEAKRGVENSSRLPHVQQMEIQASYSEAMGEREKAAEIYRVLFNLFPDNLNYGLQLAKLQKESYHSEEARETIRKLRRLPAPASQDARIDLREAYIASEKNQQLAVTLFRTAAQKAQIQGRRQVYAVAEQQLCLLNPSHLQSPPECQVAYDIFAAAGNRSSAAATLQIMAEDERLTGHEPDAIPLYQQSIQTLEQIGDYEQLAVALNNLSLLLEDQGKWSQAEDEFLKAKHNFAVVHDEVNLAIASANLADLEMLRGRFQNAAKLLKESEHHASAAHYSKDVYPEIRAAAMLVMQGRLSEASTTILQPVSLLRSWGGDPFQLANGLSGLGDIARLRGDLNGAQKNYEEASQILININASPADNQVAIAQLKIDEGHPDQAEEQINELLPEFEKSGNAGEELGAMLVLCKALLAQGKIAQTRAALERSKKLAEYRQFPALAFPIRILELQMLAADATDAKQGRHKLLEAQQGLRAIVQQSHALGYFTLECEARLALGEIEIKLSTTGAASYLSSLAADAHEREYDLYAASASKMIRHSDIAH